MQSAINVYAIELSKRKAIRRAMSVIIIVRLVGAVLIIVALSFSMGCAAVKVLLTPPVCHPTELIPTGDGGFIIVPDPCAR